MKTPDSSQISPYLAELSRCGKALAEPEQSLVEKRVGFMEQNFTRMIDKEYRPTKAEMTDFIGEPAKGAWIELRTVLSKNITYAVWDSVWRRKIRLGGSPIDGRAVEEGRSMSERAEA